MRILNDDIIEDESAILSIPAREHLARHAEGYETSIYKFQCTMELIVCLLLAHFISESKQPVFITNEELMFLRDTAIHIVKKPEGFYLAVNPVPEDKREQTKCKGEIIK